VLQIRLLHVHARVRVVRWLYPEEGASTNPFAAPQNPANAPW